MNRLLRLISLATLVALPGTLSAHPFQLEKVDALEPLQLDLVDDNCRHAPGDCITTSAWDVVNCDNNDCTGTTTIYWCSGGVTVYTYYTCGGGGGKPIDMVKSE